MYRNALKAIILSTIAVASAGAQAKTAPAAPKMVPVSGKAAAPKHALPSQAVASTKSHEEKEKEKGAPVRRRRHHHRASKAAKTAEMKHDSSAPVAKTHKP